MPQKSNHMESKHYLSIYIYIYIILYIYIYICMSPSAKFQIFCRKKVSQIILWGSACGIWGSSLQSNGWEALGSLAFLCQDQAVMSHSFQY